MRCFNSADYDSGLRLDRACIARPQKVKKSDYYPKWSGMYYLYLKTVEYVRLRGRQSTQQLGAYRYIQVNQLCLVRFKS